MEMNILLIAPQPFYADRGTPMNVRLMCKVLGEARHKVDLLVFPTGQNIQMKNVNIIRVPNIFRVASIPVGPSLIKIAYDVIMTTYLFCLCFSRKYDVIHGIEEGGFLAVFFAKLFKTSSIFDMDSCISEQLQYSKFLTNKTLLNLVASLEKLVLRNCTLALTVCTSLTEKAREFAPEAQIVQIEDVPIDSLQSADDVDMLKTELINEFGLNDAKLVVYTGNLEAYQGIDFLLEAWQSLLSLTIGPNQDKLVIVGGPAEKIVHYKKLLAKASFESDTICWTGPRPATEMSAWMEMSDVLVSPRSEGDNTPLKIYSYMSAKRPIVATDRKTHTQVLDNYTAFLVPPDDPCAFGQSIYTALNDTVLAEEKSATAKQLVDTKYSYKEFQRKLLAAYKAVTLNY